MARARENRIDNEAKEALKYFQTHTTHNSTVNGILRSCQYRYILLTRKMMYQINGEWRKCRMRDELDRARINQPSFLIRRRGATDARVSIDKNQN